MGRAEDQLAWDSEVSEAVNLHGTVVFETFTPDTLIELTLADSSDRLSLRSLQDELEAPLSVAAAVPLLHVEQPHTRPFLERLEKAGVLLMASGNGVYFNIKDRETAKGHLTANLKDPIGRFKYGWSYDSDSFRTNFVIHPVLWYSYATYLKSKGASDKETLLVTQVANLLWEGVMEGAYVPPSGLDFVTDFVSSVAGIYLYNKGPGKVLARKIMKAEQWWARHNVKLEPMFSYNPHTRGMRSSSQISFFIR